MALIPNGDTALKGMVTTVRRGHNKGVSKFQVDTDRETENTTTQVFVCNLY